MLKGISLSFVLALVAYFLSFYISIGSVAIAIILGIVYSNTVKIPSAYNSGITYAEKSILAFAIMLLGINLDFSILASLGISTILLIILGMVVTIFSTLFISKIFNIDKKFALMLGIGNGVCGASAIGATKGIVKAKEDEVGISIAVVNFLGTIGIFLVPFVAFVLGFDDTKAGILVGNTLQAVGQAVAGGFAISDTSGEVATVVKMGRVLMLTPLVVILLWIYATPKENDTKNSKSILKNIPLFIIGFIFLSIIATLQILPEFIVNIISNISKYTLIIAMAAIGLKISFLSIKENGQKALIIGCIIFIIQIAFTSLFLLLFP